VQLVVDNSKCGAGIADGTAAIGQPPKSGYSRMARPCVGTHARRPRPPADTGVAGGDGGARTARSFGTAFVEARAGKPQIRDVPPTAQVSGR